MTLVVSFSASLSGNPYEVPQWGNINQGIKITFLFGRGINKVGLFSVCQISSLMFGAEAWESGFRVPVVTGHTMCILQLLVIPVSVMIIVRKGHLSVFVETGGVNVSFFN